MEEIKQLKLQIMQLQQQLAQYQNENTSLRKKCSDWYEWSQQAQNSIDEKDQSITAYQQEIEKFQSIIREREESVGHRTVDGLYEQNQALDLKVREFKFYTDEQTKILYDFLTKKHLNSSETEKITSILIKCGSLEAKILSLLLQENRALDIQQISQKLKLDQKDIKKTAENLSQIQIITKIDHNVFTAEKTTIVSDDYQKAGIEEILSSIETRLNHANNITKACDILEEFSTAVNNQGNAVIASEIGRKSADIRRRRAEFRMKDVKDLFSEWKNQLEPKTDSAFETDKTVDIDFWATLSNLDLIEEVKNEIHGSKNTEALINTLESFKKSLMIKGGQGILIHSINGFINENKASKLLNRAICLSKIDEWERKLT